MKKPPEMGGFRIELRSCRHMYSSQNWFKSGLSWFKSNPENPYKSTVYQSIFFIVGNSSTSRMLAESVSSITRRSTPKPRPPVGGMPYSRELMKS